MTTTRDQATAEVTAAIEGNGADVATAEEFDVPAIVNEAYGWSDVLGYFQRADAEEFWAIVERHAR